MTVLRPRAVRTARLRATLSALAFSLLALSAPVFAQAQDTPPAEKGMVRAQATWDPYYLYLAFQVDDVDVLGVNKAPMSQPQEDDSVAVYLQIGKDRPATPDANTHAMIVSAAGGFTFLKGDAEKKTFVPRPLFTMKYGVSLQGTLNRSDDRDKGYTVEIAIPWDALGLDPKTLAAGTEIGFNAVVRERTGKTLTSFAEGVVSEADMASPAKWSKLVLGDATAPADSPAGTLIAPSVPQTDGKLSPPLIDGALRAANEWPTTGRFYFAAPESKVDASAVVPVAPTPALPQDTTAPPITLTLESLRGIERLLLARYRIDYQADLRKPVPLRNVFDPVQARPILSDYPVSGVGPWFSDDRVLWQKTNLTEMRQNGIDAALVEIGGPDHPTGIPDTKALLVMVHALREMITEGLPAPQLALNLNTALLTPEGAPKLDLSTDAGKDAMYNALRRWFLNIPPEFRLRVLLPFSAGGVPAYPVFLTDGTKLTGLDSDWIESMRTRFAAEFGVSGQGATLVFVGGTGFDAIQNKLVATVPFLTGGAGAGSLSTFVVQPGLDEPGGKLIPRKDTQTYRTSWEAALNAGASWFIIDSWNDWSRGTEVARSREYGPRYADLTRIYAIQTGAKGTELPTHDIRWFGHDAPRRMRPAEVANITVILQNGGTQVLRGEQGATLIYRWLNKDGQVVAESPLPIRLPGSLLPTQTRRLNLGLAAVIASPDGKLAPILPGDYTVQIDMATPEDPANPASRLVPFAEKGDAPLTFPVTILPEMADYVDFAGTTVTPLMQAGGVYPALVRLRWMGMEPLPRDSVTLTYQLLTADGKTTMATGSVPLDGVLEPGVPVTVRSMITLADTGGAPIPPSFPELAPGSGIAGGGYKLRWILNRTNSTESIPGEYTDQVAVYAGDEEARVTPSGVAPESVSADSLTMMEVTVVNRGPNKWEKGQYVVGTHWYYADGIEASWRPSMTATIPKEVAPGEAIKVMVPVRAPENDGAYIVSFDVAKAPDLFFSTRPVTRAGDIGLLYLRVTGGRQTFIDLSKLYDVDGVASEENPADGDLDGTGATFPAESFPPDLYGVNAPSAPTVKEDRKGKKKLVQGTSPAFPSGYYADISASARRIAFRYGPEEDGAKNAVACKGQTIQVPGGDYVGLHFAATATGGADKTVAITLKYKDNTTETVNISVPDWNRAIAATGDAIAIQARRKRTKDGDVSATSTLRHVIVPLKVTKQLVSFTLPNDPTVKIFAATLDK